MKIMELLEKSGIKYQADDHRPTYTAQRLAAVEHESGRFVAKPVLVKADDKFIMCVLAAHRKIDLAALKSQLGAIP